MEDSWLAEIDIERIVNDRNGDEEHEEVGNGDKSLVSGTDSAQQLLGGELASTDGHSRIQIR